MTLLPDKEHVAFLLSFLAILVDRSGGTLTIENLSDYANQNLHLKMYLEKENNRVILKTIRKEWPL